MLSVSSSFIPPFSHSVDAQLLISMADCEIPSFSLGLDLGLDSQLPSHQLPPGSSINPGACASKDDVDSDDEEFGPHVVDSDPDTGTDPPTRMLKRLRRGPGGGSSPPKKQKEPQSYFDGDDDIEEFSSQDDLIQDAPPSTRNQSLCSSSKVPLNGCRVFTPHSSSDLMERKRKHASEIPASTRLETGKSGLMFPKLTTSPLRRFQLLDSESDSDDAVGEDVSGAHKIDSLSKKPRCNPNKPVTDFERDRNVSFKLHQNQDLWKDFSPLKSFSIPTPALNDVCDEYFRSTKEGEVEKSWVGMSASNSESILGVASSFHNDEQLWDSADPLPPAHHYFFHEEPRIQNLVRKRLCNFSPLGVNRQNQQPHASTIDYMGQFSSGETSKGKGAQKDCVEKVPTRGRKKSKKLTIEETVHASAGWVTPKITSPISRGESSKRKATKRNTTKGSTSRGKSKSDKSNSSQDLNANTNWVEPKSRANVPKDAGKRRVQASGQSAGHWYTGSDGRKVYVTRNGQEMTGQAAYRHYRKESGTGFKKSKKKTGSKKRN